MQVVVITGGTAGVGRAVARRFAMDGARIAVLARGQYGLDATAAELTRLGASRAVAIRCDVADVDQVFAAADQIERTLGPIDVWINNAMTTVFGRFQSVSPREFIRVTAVTYLGVVWGTRAALDRMVPRDHGTIVQVGSALAYRSIPLQAAYCGAKHAIRGFTDAIRSELIHQKSHVRVTMVQLPAVNTPQFSWCKNHMPYEAQPVPPIFQPEPIAKAIHAAARRRRREVLVGWPAIKALIGQVFAPGYADRYLATHGYEGQLTDRPHDARRPSNLYAPVEGDHGAHGAFDTEATGSRVLVPATTWLGAGGVRAVLGGAAALALVAAALAWRS